MARVEQIISAVLQTLQDEGQRGIKRETVLYYLNEVQGDLCEEYLILEAKKRITLVPGKDSYPLGAPIYKVALVHRPLTWLYPFSIVHDPNEYRKEIEHLGSFAAQPVVGYIWQDRLEVFPAPTVEEELSFDAYLSPSEVEDDTEDPDVPVRWDKALRLGILAALAGGDWAAQFETECVKTSGRKRKKSIEGVSKMQHWSDRMGF